MVRPNSWRDQISRMPVITPKFHASNYLYSNTAIYVMEKIDKFIILVRLVKFQIR